MTLTDIIALGERAIETGVYRDWDRAVFPTELLPLLKALKEWRDAWNADDVSGYEPARTALLSLIGDSHE